MRSSCAARARRAWVPRRTSGHRSAINCIARAWSSSADSRSRCPRSRASPTSLARSTPKIARCCAGGLPPRASDPFVSTSTRAIATPAYTTARPHCKICSIGARACAIYGTCAGTRSLGELGSHGALRAAAAGRITRRQREPSAHFERDGQRSVRKSEPSERSGSRAWLSCPSTRQFPAIVTLNS